MTPARALRSGGKPIRRTRMDLKSNYASPPPLLSRGIPNGDLSMDGAQARIAILDDDQSVRNAIARLLKASQMDVETFPTYIELFNYLQHGAPDCLVLDLQMPGMNGFDVLRYLAQRGFRLPVVMITAHDGPGTSEACIAAGAAAYVRKPLDATALLQAIADAIGAPH